MSRSRTKFPTGKHALQRNVSSSEEVSKLLRNLRGSHMFYNLLRNVKETFFTMLRRWLEG